MNTFGLSIKGEVSAGEEALGLMLAIQQRHVRLDPAPHQPTDHQPRPVGGIGGQPLRL
jgi:hypothetical protein